MPTRNLSTSERLARIEGRFDASDEYTREKWHNLANDMTPLLALPERLTRDVAKIDAKVDVQINAMARELERTVLAAIKEAIAPVKAEMAELRTDVDALKEQSNKLTGAKLLIVFIIQTVIAAIAAVSAVFALRGAA